jgi:ribosome maturation factor RimP
MRAQSELEIRILDMIEPVATEFGLEVVRVRVMGGDVPTLQIMAERPDGSMTVAACAKFSRAISPVLEAEDPISTEYHLEVSSPGIDRPLTRVGEFANWVGHEIKVELATPGADGRKRFHGAIVGETDGVVELSLKDGGSASLPVADMAKASMVLTEKLIQAARAKAPPPGEGGEDEDDEEFAGLGDELGDDFDDVEVDEDEESEDDADGEDDFDDGDQEDEDERN